MTRRRLLALPAAIGAALMIGGTAAAWPPGTVTVDTDGCQFTINIDLDGQPTVIGWEVREYNAVPLDGTLVMSGFDNPDAEGRLTVGPQVIAAGHYNAIVDDETPVDASSSAVDFTLACETPSPTGSELPTATASQTASPTGEELPIQGTPPAGGEAGITPPPTDAPSTTADTTSGLPIVLAGILGLTGASLAFTIRRPRAVSADRDRRERS